MKKVFNYGYDLGWFAKDENGVVYHTFEDPSCNDWNEVPSEEWLDAGAFGEDDTADLALIAWKALYWLVKARP